MKAAGIIAAGLGERLRDSHPGIPKPLVRVGGRPLVHWVVRGLLEAGMERLLILFNSGGDAARDSLKAAFPRAGLDFLRADTASSFESFRLVAGTLAAQEERFLISTVDALIPPPETSRFAAEALGSGDGPWAAVALTRFVEDEQPLWAELGPGGLVRAFGDAATRRETVTCGLYALTRRAAQALPPAASCPRLRDYWAALALAGRPVRGIVLADTVDVDRPDDIPSAERLTRCFPA